MALILIPFHWMDNIPHCTATAYLVILSSADGCLGVSSLAVVHNAAVSPHEGVFASIFIFSYLGYYYKEGDRYIK